MSYVVYLSVSGGTGESKGKRKQNVVPLQINEILEAPEEGFLVEGQEVGMMVIVGKVMDCEKATTKTTYKVSRLSNCPTFYATYILQFIIY